MKKLLFAASVSLVLACVPQPAVAPITPKYTSDSIYKIDMGDGVICYTLGYYTHSLSCVR